MSNNKSYEYEWIKEDYGHVRYWQIEGYDFRFEIIKSECVQQSYWMESFNQIHLQ